MIIKKKKLTKKEYSKKATTIILAFAIIDVQLSYILAFIGMAEIAETLSVAMVTEIIGVFGGYLIKAYLGKKNEEKNRILEEQYERENSDGLD